MGRWGSSQLTDIDDQERRKWYAGFRSLSSKASLLVVVLIMVIISAGMTLSIRAMSFVLLDNEYTRAREWAVSLTASSSKPVACQDQASLDRVANELIQMHKLAYVVFSDASERVVASAATTSGLLKSVLLPEGRTPQSQSLFKPRLLEFETAGLTCVDVTVPVYAEKPIPRKGKTSRPIVGYLRLGINMADTTVNLQEIKNHLLRIAIAVILLVVPCSLLVTRYVVKPLNELARTARAIAKGTMDARAQINSNDEIGELSKSFNTMADRIIGSQLELLQLNADLEKRVQERTSDLEELASREPLTGLYNRRHFGEVIGREFASAERYDADMTCLMFDLDHFKKINDRFGHRCGDDILITLANAISDELRSSDLAARFGGDEFVALLPQTSAAAAKSLANRVVRKFTNETAKEFPGIPVTLSIGIASLRTTRAPTAEALIQEADMALYAAKQNGRNCTIEAKQPSAIG